MRQIPHLFSIVFTFLLFSVAHAQQEIGNQHVFDEFTYRQGNQYRTASGNPGPEYWQNQADYVIEVALDDKNHTVTDRKSTRLNSSHVAISYAVFCLKKKIKIRLSSQYS